MTALKKRSKVPTNPIERAIYYREAGIRRMRQNIVDIKEDASDKIAAIEADIRQKQVLLDALKRGTLKP